MKFELTGKQLQVNLKLQSTKARHVYRLKQLISEGYLDQVHSYLNSFQGKRERHIGNYITRFRPQKETLKENRILDLYNSRRDFDENHSPFGASSDWIGVEIECMLPANVANQSCQDCDGSGIQYDDNDDECECNECEGTGSLGTSRLKISDHFRKDNRIKFTSIKQDGSLRPDSGFRGVEITVLTRLSDPSNLLAVCQILNKLGAKVNKSCGLHVHLDQRGKTEEEVLAIGKAFSRAMPVMVAMVPESRRSNTYCQASVSKLSGDRYHAVNLTAFKRHKTIEVRLHSATTDFNKIMNWARFMKAVSVSRIPKVCADINALTEYVNIDQDLMEYIGQRTALFSPAHNSTSPQVVDTDATDRVEPAAQIDLMHPVSQTETIQGAA